MGKFGGFPFALWLVALPRYTKRAILAVSDFVLLNVALWAAISLRLGEFYAAPDRVTLVALLAAPVVTIALFSYMGIYRSVTRFPSGQFAAYVIGGLSVSALCWGLSLFSLGWHIVPRSVLVIYPLVAALLVLGSRHAVGGFLRLAGARAANAAGPAKRAIIYGAGATGMQLLDALRSSGSCKVIAFVDASPNLPGQYLGGVKVFRPSRLADLIENYEIDEVLLALPRARRSDRQTALRQLEELKVPVRILPAMEDVAAGRVTVSDLRPVEAEDLLGRDPVPPDPSLLARNIAGKCVLVTGAGGSIGSELARQIIRQGPAKLVLVEMSEAQLYQIDMELVSLIDKLGPELPAKPQIVSGLGSVLDTNLMRKVLSEHGVHTIYHAAAFKHVPIVEHNPVAGIENNTFGTCVLADAAAAAGVERFVLVSTDKAVRPTSVMGASKRLAEMALQARATEAGCATIFTMVRFGNVLDSSGSVLRRFRRQIESGGPVTVTHPDMVRYFMSIPEAATLVIQAGAMASGGDVFVLDMGEPVRILDLARSMIRLMGQEVRDADNPDGDIAITFVGVRDGEKMFEELLLGENVVATAHPCIRRSLEPFLERPLLESALGAVRGAMSAGDAVALRQALGQAIDTYTPVPGLARKRDVSKAA